MTYLTNVANEQPMLRISAAIILAFACAAPFVLLFSGVVGYGVRSLIRWKQIARATAAAIVERLISQQSRQRYVRFTLESGHSWARFGCPLWANSRLMHCNKNRG
jgi:hypothetical protein